MHEFAKDLYRIGRELRGGELGGWLTLAASVLIVVAATWRVLVAVAVGLRTAWGWLRGQGRPAAEDDFPEGA